MNDTAQHNEYLKAMGIDSWIPRAELTARAGPSFRDTLEVDREPATDAPPIIYPSDAVGAFILGPGSGSMLLLCGGSEEAADALAFDIARSLASEPVWAWPAEPDSGLGLPLQQAIEERLFTRVLVFGPGLVARSEDKDVEVIGSACLLRTDSMEVLVARSSARRALWLQLNDNGCLAERARKS